MTSPDRERLAFEQVRRWPVWFGLQYFLSFLGAITLLTYIANKVAAIPVTRSVGRDAVPAAIVAVLFTLIMRRRSRRAA